MDYKTKAYYRDKINKIAKRTKISELYIAKKALELAKISKNNISYQNEDEINTNNNEKEYIKGSQTKDELQQNNNIEINESLIKTNSNMQEQNKESHIGYYLISDGINELYKTLQTSKKPKSTKKSVMIYIMSIILLSTLISGTLSIYIFKQTNIILSILIFILTYIPSTQIATEIIQYILNKISKPKLIPKMDYINGVPKEATTMVIIPGIVKNKEKVKELISKLEVFYLANKSENIYFTLLGDATSSKKEIEEFDEEIMEQGKKEIEKLNRKYPNNGMGKFQFIYRKRIWNESENCFLGWERKRGLINEFNEYLQQNIENPFRLNTLEEWRIKNLLPKIKYIITLDSDTNLTLNSGLELIGAAAHILNRPKLNEEKDLVISGHALIQPHIGIDLISARKSLFTKIYAGARRSRPVCKCNI